jgi:hypothetical protein
MARVRETRGRAAGVSTLALTAAAEGAEDLDFAASRLLASVAWGGSGSDIGDGLAEPGRALGRGATGFEDVGKSLDVDAP